MHSQKLNRMSSATTEQLHCGRYPSFWRRTTLRWDKFAPTLTIM